MGYDPIVLSMFKVLCREDNYTKQLVYQLGSALNMYVTLFATLIKSYLTVEFAPRVTVCSATDDFDAWEETLRDEMERGLVLTAKYHV